MRARQEPPKSHKEEQKKKNSLVGSFAAGTLDASFRNNSLLIFFFSSGSASSFFFFGSLTLGFRELQCRFFVSVYSLLISLFVFGFIFVSIFVLGVSLSLSLTTSSNPLTPNSVFLLSCYHNRIPNITRFAILYNTSTPLDLPLRFIIQGTLPLCISSDSLPLIYPIL